MKIQIRRFNFILLLTLGLVVSGCSSPGPKAKKVKEPTTLRFHLEVNRDGSDKSGPVTIGRSAPFGVNVQKEAFLTEFDITEARVVDDSMGGFSLRIQCNRRGTWLLEQYTTANKGRRAAIFCQFGTNAWWLAAPIMEKRIADGAFSFTPDASRVEADRIVRGLNQQGVDVKKDDR